MGSRHGRICSGHPVWFAGFPQNADARVSIGRCPARRSVEEKKAGADVGQNVDTYPERNLAWRRHYWRYYRPPRAAGDALHFLLAQHAQGVTPLCRRCHAAPPEIESSVRNAKLASARVKEFGVRQKRGFIHHIMSLASLN